MIEHASVDESLDATRIGRLCTAAGMSRQNYYKQRVQRRRQQVDEELVLELIRRERARHPRLGSRKLLHLIGADLESAQVSIGRDRFFRLAGPT